MSGLGSRFRWYHAIAIGVVIGLVLAAFGGIAWMAWIDGRTR